MEFKTDKKIFKHAENDSLVVRDNPKNERYYAYISEMKQSGFRQIFLPTSHMIDLVKIYENNSSYFELEDIKLLNSDLEYENHLESILGKYGNRKVSFDDIIDELEGINDNDNVEVQNTSFFYKIGENKFNVTIFFNGVIYMESNIQELDDELTKLCNNIELIQHNIKSEEA